MKKSKPAPKRPELQELFPDLSEAEPSRSRFRLQLRLRSVVKEVIQEYLYMYEFKSTYNSKECKWNNIFESHQGGKVVTFDT
jgi:hypothetical protein